MRKALPVTRGIFLKFLDNRLPLLNFSSNTEKLHFQYFCPVCCKIVNT